MINFYSMNLRFRGPGPESSDRASSDREPDERWASDDEQAAYLVGEALGLLGFVERALDQERNTPGDPESN